MSEIYWFDPEIQKLLIELGRYTYFETLPYELVLIIVDKIYDPRILLNMHNSTVLSLNFKYSMNKIFRWKDKVKKFGINLNLLPVQFHEEGDSLDNWITYDKIYKSYDLIKNDIKRI